MGLNEVASADRLHIGFFGKRNAGKSSLVNALTSQELSVVSDYAGTTTDPVRKAMELAPLGPVVIIDTPGLDDEGELGALRVARARQILNLVDVAVVVVDARCRLGDLENEIIERLESKKIPYIIAYNKSDLEGAIKEPERENGILVSAVTGENVNALKVRLAALSKDQGEGRVILGDLIKKGDTVVLVIPIDKAAPKGRLILPQQQTIRDILDAGAFAVTCRDSELEDLLSRIGRPIRMVVTDSQVFGRVSKIVPKDIELTSFSILFARYKGNLEGAVKGAAMLDRLSDGDKVLVSEGCTHHRQCGDIGTVKLPMWIRSYTGKNIDFEFTSGRDFPEDLSGYSLVIHCGGCMLTEREMQYRARLAQDEGVPMTNYGMVIAHTHGILRRSLEPFGEIANEIRVK